MTLAFFKRLLASEMTENLQYAVQMSHAGPKSVQEIIESVFAFGQILLLVLDLIRQGLEKLDLYAGKGLERFFTRADQFWVSLFPLGQLILSLRVHLIASLQNLFVNLKELL